MINNTAISLAKKNGKVLAQFNHQAIKANAKPKKARKKTRILSIDGGGIRGIVPATILAHLEKRIQQKTNQPDARLSDYFDLVAGTSTGGILGCFYLMPDSKNPDRPKLTAQETLEIYFKFGKNVFTQSFLRKLVYRLGLVKEKFSARPMNNTLKKLFGKKLKLSQLIKPCLITTYNKEEECPMIYHSLAAWENKVNDVKVWQLARATSAASQYYKPAVIRLENGVTKTLIDGSIFAQSPAMCAYDFTRRRPFLTSKNASNQQGCLSVEEVIMVSIGTGVVKQRPDFKKVGKKVDLRWIKSIIGLMKNGSSKRVDSKLKKILSEEASNNHYFRLAPKLHEASPELDNTTPKNLQALHRDGLQYIDENYDMLEQLVDTLIH